MKIAIIGAGPSGLAALKHSLDAGHICEVFEQTAFIGGTWKYVEEVGKDEYGLPIHSSAYEDLSFIYHFHIDGSYNALEAPRDPKLFVWDNDIIKDGSLLPEKSKSYKGTNKPKELMLFEDFPYREDLVCSYISHVDVMDYINDYAQYFELLPNIKFLHHVENISPIQGERWLVKVKNLKTAESEKIEFDCVIVCVGHYSTPVTPNITGMESFKGTIIHSHDYKKMNPYIDRKVLIVGNGPSGVDICNRVHRVAKKVVLCLRTPRKIDISHILPVDLMKKPPIEQFYENSVKFEDQSVEEFDDVIFCTGYKISFPFLFSNSGLEVGDSFIKYLYKHTINIEHPTMAVIGIPKNVPLFPMFCLQVRFFLAHLSGHFKASKEEMKQDVEKHLKNCQDSGKPPHMNIGLDFRNFLADLAETANIKGIRPVILEIFDFLIQEGLGKYDIAYKIVNDNEFEHFRYNN